MGTLIRSTLLAAVVLRTLAAQAPDTTAILSNVEKRYNSTKTLQANFTTTFKDHGRTHTPERGVVYLNKKNHQSRWDYTDPAGNFFLSGDKVAYDYDKEKKTVERIPIKETDDMRIPLSFLLGDLNFEKDFKRREASREGENTVIRLFPKNENLLFKEITMLVAPDASILRVSVLGQDGSTMQYVLESEKRNIPLSDSLFRYTTPPGAQLVEARN
ncbi:MAG: outer membrane lipoprotein carrier protein LolA [Acidobacteriota bacterium]